MYLSPRLPSRRRGRSVAPSAALADGRQRAHSNARLASLQQRSMAHRSRQLFSSGLQRGQTRFIQRCNSSRAAGADGGSNAAIARTRAVLVPILTVMAGFVSCRRPLLPLHQQQQQHWQQPRQQTGSTHRGAWSLDRVARGARRLDPPPTTAVGRPSADHGGWSEGLGTARLGGRASVWRGYLGRGRERRNGREDRATTRAQPAAALGQMEAAQRRCSGGAVAFSMAFSTLA